MVKINKNKKITVKGNEIAIMSINGMDFISLTDMVRNFGDDMMIYSWLRNRNTIEFIGIWAEKTGAISWLHAPAWSPSVQ